MSARPPIVHPGPASRERHALAWATAVPLDFTLARGEAAETGLARAVAAAGCDSACFEISGCRFDPFRAPCEWVPGEILLIESEHGLTCHNVLGRWPLLPPPQGTFPFSDPPSWCAASGWR